jgi:hypothetical protein
VSAPDPRIAEASRDFIALAIACSDSDRLAADTLLATYAGYERALLDGAVHVLRSVALTRVTEAGGTFSEAAIPAGLRSMLTGAFAERT